MEPRELRIGNIVHHEQRGKDYTYINSRDIQNIEEGTEWGKMFSPLTLTEEWLVRLGFEDDGYMQIPPNRKYSFASEIYLIVSEDLQSVQISIGDATAYIDCHHVHELQNLYHALTGKELTAQEK